MKVGDAVEMSPMWKHEHATGKIVKINSDYIVVKWTGSNGEWHYTKEQSKRLKVLRALE